MQTLWALITVDIRSSPYKFSNVLKPNTNKSRFHQTGPSHPRVNQGAQANQTSLPTMSQQRLAPKRRIILQEIIDVPDPIVLLPRARALFFRKAPVVLRVRDGRAVDARNRVERRAHGHGFAWGEDVRDLAVHREACGRARAFADLWDLHTWIGIRKHANRNRNEGRNGRHVRGA